MNRTHTYRTLAALAAGATLAVASVAAASTGNGAAALALKVAKATDARQVIVMRQQITKTYSEVYYSDAPEQVSAEFMGTQLSSGDVRGSWYSLTSKRCYAISKERFVGLSTIGYSLLPQSSGRVVTVSYQQVEPHALRWTIAKTSQHGTETGTVWFNSRGVIVKSQTKAFKSGPGTANATSVTLTYPAKLPGGVPTHLPSRACPKG